MRLIFTPDDSGAVRAVGYSTVPYSSDDKDELVVETTDPKLASIFETAKSDGETLDGADSSIEAAIDDPLSYIDYLILDTNDAIAFDSDYVRETPDETQA